MFAIRFSSRCLAKARRRSQLSSIESSAMTNRFLPQHPKCSAWDCPCYTKAAATHPQRRCTSNMSALQHFLQLTSVMTVHMWCCRWVASKLNGPGWQPCHGQQCQPSPLLRHHHLHHHIQNSVITTNCSSKTSCYSSLAALTAVSGCTASLLSLWAKQRCRVLALGWMGS